MSPKHGADFPRGWAAGFGLEGLDVRPAAEPGRRVTGGVAGAPFGLGPGVAAGASRPTPARRKVGLSPDRRLPSVGHLRSARWGADGHDDDGGDLDIRTAKSGLSVIGAGGHLVLRPGQRYSGFGVAGRDHGVGVLGCFGLGQTSERSAFLGIERRGDGWDRP